jgi:murein DD-endopeptidase MepM/ murein hydrolase activator NlpD
MPAGCYSPPTTTDRVISRQGWRTLPGEPTRWHNGEDYAGDEGDPFLAVRAGIIEAWYPSGAIGVRGYGNTIVIRHAPDVITVYAHALDTRRDVGAFVTAGEQIGRIGRTSGRGGDPSAVVLKAHLHFEIVRRWPLRADDRAARYDVAATLAGWRAACETAGPAEPAAPPAPPWAAAPRETEPPTAAGDRRGAGDVLPWLAILVIVAGRRRRT